MSPKKGLDDRMLAAQVAIDGALGDAEVLALLTPYGYTEVRLREGRALYDEVMALVRQQRLEYGEQYQASHETDDAWERAKDAYARTLKVARVAFKENEKAEAALGLRGARRTSLAGWLEQATLFYRNLLDNPDLLAVMEPLASPRAKLEQELTLVEAVRSANVMQAKETGEAHEATKRRDAKLSLLSAWLSDFRTIAQAALAERPQLLEKLGFGPIR